MVSISRLGLSGVCLKEEQLAAVKGVYEGQDVFVCLPTRAEPVLPNPAISNGAQTEWK